MFSATKIPCCLCGTMIFPNDANQCSTCLAQQFDLRDVLQKNGEPHIVHQCRQCRRFARTETLYEFCEPESPELLSICLKKIPALITSKSGTSSKLQIVDAIWVWTEPHSMRLKVRLTMRTEMESVQVKQRVLVEYHIHWKMCDNCNREYTNRTWHALVQLRQKRDLGANRKGLAAMEMALRRNKDIRKKVLKIDACKNGLDFYFLTLQQAQSFAHFLAKLAPMRIKTSQKLVSADVKSNTANMKHTLTCDVVPLTRDDLVVIHKHTRGILAGRLGLVIKASSMVHIVDASPKRLGGIDVFELSSDAYHKFGQDRGFTIIQTPERMVRFVVLDVELCDDENNTNDADDRQLYEGPASGVEKYAMADVLVARESDMGSNDLAYSCVTHLGHLIQPGDVVLGYDLESTAASLSASSSNGVVDVEDIVHSNVVLPDVVLVKKVAGKEVPEVEAEDDEQAAGKKRMSKKKLRRQKKQDKRQRDLEESAARMGFLDDVEQDFEQVLENDPELAAELDAMEKQLDTFKDDTPTEETPRASEGQNSDEARTSS